MQIIFNGQRRDVSDGISVAKLLVEHQLEPKHVAVEVNLELVPRQDHAARILRAGDRLEVVTLVGGG